MECVHVQHFANLEAEALNDGYASETSVTQQWQSKREHLVGGDGFLHPNST